MKKAKVAIRISMLVYLLVVYPFFHFNTPIRFLFIDSFLAYIPIEFYFILRKVQRKPSFYVLGFFYVLFLPNNAYLFTDLIHLSRIPFYTNSELIMTESTYSWFMFALVIIGIFGLTLIGFQTELSLVYRLKLKYQWSNPLYLILQFGIFIVVSCGVFLGRFLRWNSVEVFTHPAQILKSLGQLVTAKGLMFILLFTLIQAALYGILLISKNLFTKLITTNSLY